MHLQENTLFVLTLANIRPSSTSCDLYTCKNIVAMSKGLKETQSTFHLGVKVAQSIAQYHLHHVTYTPAEFEVAMSNGLIQRFKRRSIYKKIHSLTLTQGDTKHCPVPSTSYDAYICKV